MFGYSAIWLFGVGQYLFWPKSDDHRGREGKEREIMQSAREFGQGLLYFVCMCAAIRASCFEAEMEVEVEAFELLKCN